MNQNKRKHFFRRCMTAALAVASVSAVFDIRSAAESDSDFFVMEEHPDIADAVALTRYVTEDRVTVPDWLRPDVNCDGFVDLLDVVCILDHIGYEPLIDAVFENEDAYREIQDGFRLEMAEKYAVSDKMVSVFYGFLPQYVVPYEPDRLMIERVFTIAAGDGTGMKWVADPYFNDLVYNGTYDAGDIVMVFNVYADGDYQNILETAEFCIGSTTDYGF